MYLLVLNKAHTQEEFIRGSMTKNPYASSEIGPLMRDVKNKICRELDLFSLLDDDFSMELLVAGNIISLDLSIAQVYELVWKKSVSTSTLLSPGAAAAGRDGAPMTVTYRLQVCCALQAIYWEMILSNSDDSKCNMLCGKYKKDSYSSSTLLFH